MPLVRRSKSPAPAGTGGTNGTNGAMKGTNGKHGANGKGSQGEKVGEGGMSSKNGKDHGMVDARQAAVPTFLGLPLKWVSLVALTFQTSWQVFVVKYARLQGAKHLNTSVIFIAEIMKTLLSFLFLAHEQGSLVVAARSVRQQVMGNPLGTMRFCIPGLAYAIMNNLVFLSLDKLSAPVQQVTYQLKILTAAGLSVVMLGKTVSRTQWSALVLLVVGVSVVQWPRSADGSLQTSDFAWDADALVGFLAVLSAAFMGGFGGVYMEMMLKQAGSIWLRNVQLGFFGAWMSLFGVFVQDRERVAEGGFFQGYTLVTLGPVFVLSTGGLLVAVAIRYADNILRQFSTAFSIILTSLCSSFILQEFSADLLFVLGATTVIAATFMYNLGLPLWLTNIADGHQEAAKSRNGRALTSTAARATPRCTSSPKSGGPA